MPSLHYTISLSPQGFASGRLGTTLSKVGKEVLTEERTNLPPAVERNVCNIALRITCNPANCTEEGVVLRPPIVLYR